MKPAIANIDVFVDREAEQFILGACLEWPKAYAMYAGLVRCDDFASQHHQAIWTQIERAAAMGHEVSWLTVRTLLLEAKQLEDVTSAYLSELTRNAVRPDESTAMVLAARLRRCRAARQLVYLQDRARRELEADPTVLQRGFIERLREQLAALEGDATERHIPSHLMSFGEVMTEIHEEWTAGPPDFIRTPWPDLDYRLEGGIVPGEMVVLGARPGAGKTAMAGQIALKVTSAGRSVIVVSREMKRTQIGGRLIAAEGGVDAGAIRRVRFMGDQRQRAEAAMGRISQLPGFITHAPMSIEGLRELVFACQQEAPIGLLIVDYLQLIDAPAHLKDRRLQVEAVSAGLKKMTLDFNLPILALSSLSRGMDERAKPTLRSLRESGNIEHDADTVLLLHRPDQDEMADLIVAKARQGNPGELQLLFHKKHQRFDQLDQIDRAHAGV